MYIYSNVISSDVHMHSTFWVYGRITKQNKNYKSVVMIMAAGYILL